MYGIKVARKSSWVEYELPPCPWMSVDVEDLVAPIAQGC
jgi:hypothetical protein